MAEIFQREWKVAKPAAACADCGEVLAVSVEAHASLHEEGDGYARRDRCAACWGRVAERGFSHWAYKPAPPPEKPFRADLVAIRDFYMKLAGKEAASDRLLRYLLGLYLVRKKRLWLERTERAADGEILWIRFEKEGAAEPVPVPPFTPEDLLETRRRLDALLGVDVGDLEAQPATAG